MTPNFFILGAAKSGTTSLWGMLRQHPHVHMSNPKEPSFFCSYFQVVSNPIDYFRLFDSERRWRGDSSHLYLSNPETAPVLHALFPEARFIVIVRDPKARAHALYRHMRRYRHADGAPLELLDRFEDALNAEDGRYGEPVFATSCRQYFWNFMYCRSGFFDVQLARYIDLYGRDKFLILTLAELSREPERVCHDIGGFLGIAPGPLLAQSGQVLNDDPERTVWSAEADAIMVSRFQGVTERTEGLAGRRLDWSL